jgi:hypothetical protein
MGKAMSSSASAQSLAVSTASCGRGARLSLPKTPDRAILRPTTCPINCPSRCVKRHRASARSPVRAGRALIWGVLSGVIEIGVIISAASSTETCRVVTGRAV